MKTVLRKFGAFFWMSGFILAGLTSGWTASIQSAFQQSLPVYDGEVSVAGLQRPVIIERDAFAVPHIRAENVPDLFLAQGYVTAQDRLWQLDLQRRLASGRLAEIFGSVSLSSDRFYRRLGLQRNLRGRASDLAEPTRRLLQAYADGVNAFIEANRTRLLPEFVILNYQPERWSVEDTLLLLQLGAWSLSTSYHLDLLREQAASRLSAQQLADLFPTASSQDVIQFVTPKSERLKQGSATKTQRHQATESGGHFPLDETLWLGAFVAPTSGLSNNWVVAGHRTLQGQSLLSNDTHLLVAMPSLMTMVHLSAPELHVQGIALPGMPGIIAGRNEHIAWGVTNFPADVQDLFRLRFRSLSSNDYLLDGEWVPADVVPETIRIKAGQGFTTETLPVLISRFGPLLDRRGTTGQAIQWNMYDALAEEWEAFFGLNRARNWDEVVRALETYPGPGQNVLYADRDGHIGLQAAGRIPLRGAGDGTVPLAAESGSVGWQGWIVYEDLPRRFDPETGWLVAANQRIVDEAYPHLITKSWGAPFRARRIATLLSSAEKLTLEDMRRIQADAFSFPDQLLARQIASVAETVGGLSEDERRLLNELGSWNGLMEAESYWPTILDLTRQELFSRLLSGPLGEAWTSSYTASAFDAAQTFLFNLLERRPSGWLPPGVASYDELLLQSWRQALAQARSRFGELNRAWWGDYASLYFGHAFGRSSAYSRLFDRGPIRLSGSGLTVNFHHNSLAVGMRLLMDFAQAECTWACIPSGISGHALSPHYQDQIERWQSVMPLPLPFRAEPSSSNGLHRLVLQPLAKSPR